MKRVEHINLMATYNSWMNAKLYTTTEQLSEAELSANRGAYFGSILGTLNHIMVADSIWLKRFATHPANHQALNPIRESEAPISLDQILFKDIQSLAEHRYALDAQIVDWAKSLTEADLDYVLPYASMKGIAAKRVFFSLIMHFFNHQTHHRGQVTTLLTQLGYDIGATDLLELVDNQSTH